MKNTPQPLLLALALLQGAAIVLFAALALAGSTPSHGAPSPSPTAGAAATAPAAGTTQAPADAALPSPDAPRAADDANAPARAAAATTTTLLVGRVQLADGRPLRHAWISLFRGESTQPHARTSPSYQSSDFAIPGLEPGAWRLTIGHDGFRPFERAFVIERGTTLQRVDATLEASWLVKVLLVTSDGRPLGEALRELQKQNQKLFFASFDVTVVATWSAPPVPFPVSDVRGGSISVAQWRASHDVPRGTSLPARYAGVVEMPERRHAFLVALLRDAVIAQCEVEPGQEEARMTVDPARLLPQYCSVRLQLVDESTRAPVAGATVSLHDAERWAGPSGGEKTDAEGRAELKQVLPGLQVLGVQAEGRSAPAVQVRLAPGSSVDLGQVPLAHPFKLSGRIANRSEGQNIRLTLTPLAAPPPSMEVTDIQLWTQDDRFECQLAPGRYRLSAIGGGAARLEFDTQSLGSEPLVVQLQPTAKLRLDPAGLDDPAELTLRAADGAVWLRRWITWKGAWDQEVLPGAYTLSLRRLGGAVTEERIDVPAGSASYRLH